MKYKPFKSIKNILYTTFVIILANQLMGCAVPHEVQRNTTEEKIKLEKMRAGLPKMYDSLLTAAAPLCKQASCNYPLEIIDKKDINAFADGRKIYVTTAMLDFANTNEELAIILSHELAHNLMEHITSQQKNQILGLIFDLAAAAGGVDTEGTFTTIAGQVYSQEFELEADYVGLYLMARAGYSVNNAAHFWRKMAIKFPQNIQGNIMSSHPGSAERFIILEKTAHEINIKRKNKQILLPEITSER